MVCWPVGLFGLFGLFGLCGLPAWFDHPFSHLNLPHPKN
jgi:hypothetical protein